MPDHQDVIQFLEAKLAALSAETKVVKAALEAARGAAKAITAATSKSDSAESRSPAWRQHVISITGNMRHGDTLTLDNVMKVLKTQGIAQASSSSGRSAVNTTLNRMANDGDLIKVRPGLYQIKRNKPDLLIEGQASKEQKNESIAVTIDS